MITFILRSMPASVLFLTINLGLSACGPRLANRNIDALNEQFEAAEKVGKSLSVKEVEAILGQPTREENFPIEMQTTRELQGLRYYYAAGGKTVELHFIDNKLIRRAQHLEDSTAGGGGQRTRPKATPANAGQRN